MPVRKIIKVDEERCTGCGLCVVDCAEGALKIIDGKARVIKDSFCDGLGACIGSCPENALEIIEREADDFDEAAVEAHLEAMKHGQAHAPQAQPQPEPIACGCPGSMIRTFSPPPAMRANDGEAVSALSQWPVQLRLLPTSGPLYHNKNLMIVADCVAVADPDLHRRLIAGNTIVITCPKLDNATESIDKLAKILQNPIKYVGVAIMEVPCCTGLLHIVREAARLAGRTGEIELIQISLRGELLHREPVTVG